jgi:site-specific DNA recombinase
MQSDAKLKYFAYMRKSSEDKEKQILSIPAQRDRLTERFGDLDVEFIEEERSAFVPYNRPKFDEMLAGIRSGERRGIIAWNPDRLSRNEVDASSITYMLRTGVILDLKFVTCHFENTPEGIWTLQMALSQSQYESAKKGRDVKRGLEKKASMGIYPAPAPLGYRNDKYEERGKKKIYTDDQVFPTLRRMVDLMLTGRYTPPQILRIANNEWGFRGPNGKKMARSSIYNLFTRPFYYGEFEYPAGSGIWYTGVHNPLMSRDEYDRIQALLGRPSTPRPRSSHEFEYRGKIRCGECGAMITAEKKSKRLSTGKVAQYVYYHCTKRKNPNCSQKGIELKDLERQIVEQLARLQISADFKDWAFNAVKKMNARESSDCKNMLAAQRREYDACLRRIENLIDMRANGEINEDEFRSRKHKLDGEKERLFEYINDSDRRVRNWLEIAERALNFAELAASLYNKAQRTNDLGAKREIFEALGSKYVLKDGKLVISLDNVLIPIQVAAEEIQKNSARLEPGKERGAAGQMGAAYDQNPRLLRVVDEVRTIARMGDTRFAIQNLFATAAYRQDTLLEAAA